MGLQWEFEKKEYEVVHKIRDLENDLNFKSQVLRVYISCRREIGASEGIFIGEQLIWQGKISSSCVYYHHLEKT